MGDWLVSVEIYANDLCDILRPTRYRIGDSPAQREDIIESNVTLHIEHINGNLLATVIGTMPQASHVARVPFGRNVDTQYVIVRHSDARRFRILDARKVGNPLRPDHWLCILQEQPAG